eukprot:scaffold2846_cov322-Pavlova_lutheri.AAC.27
MMRRGMPSDVYTIACAYRESSMHWQAASRFLDIVDLRHVSKRYSSRVGIRMHQAPCDRKEDV